MYIITLELFETADIATTSQVIYNNSLYKCDGNNEERVLGFKNVSNDGRTSAQFQHVFNTLGICGCGKKLVAQIYDGAAMATEHNGLQCWVREHVFS